MSFNKKFSDLFFLIAIICTTIASKLARSLNPNRKPRFFILDLHSAVTADIKNIFERLGYEIVFWSISPHFKRVFGKECHQVDFINQHNWYNLKKENFDLFYKKYKYFLKRFDGFVVTHPPIFSLIFEKLNKPIIIINAVRYEHPHKGYPKKWRLDKILKRMVNNGKCFIVSNNKADEYYLKYYTGISSQVIPSLCSYTKAKYTGLNNKFICHKKYYFYYANLLFKRLERSGLLQEHIHDFYSWEELYDYKGIIHFPYQISTMSIFEQYTANIPLFFPSKSFLFSLWEHNKKEILFECSISKNPIDLNNINDPDIMRFWVDNADFYDEKNMPHIQYFNSFDHLEDLLKTTDLKEISQKMKIHNIQREEKILNQWRELLKQIKLVLL